VRPGTLFVAVPSVGGDALSGGYDYLPQVLAAGAAGVVLQAGTPPPGIPSVYVDDARGSLADLSAAFFGHPSRELQLFAITGTDGKTTSTYILEQVLASAGFCTGLLGTVETKIGEERLANADRMTTPESLDVQRLLRRMVDAGVTHVALEASSHALALDRLRACSVAAAALTNITADHIEFHGSWEVYFQTKLRLFTELAAGRPAILNRDLDVFARVAACVKGPILSYGFDPRSHLRAEIITPHPRTTVCRFHSEGREALVRVPIPGRFNVSNALAAAGVALAAGVDLDRVADAITHATPPPGRMQPVASDAPLKIVIDNAHTPNPVHPTPAASHASPGGARLLGVVGAAGNRDRYKRPELARIARAHADFFFITNEDPFDEDPDEIMDQIASGVPAEEEGKRYLRVTDRGDAIRLAIDQARPGDVVAILGKGHERSIAVGSRKQPWSDVEAAHRALELKR